MITTQKICEWIVTIESEKTRRGDPPYERMYRRVGWRS